MQHLFWSYLIKPIKFIHIGKIMLSALSESDAGEKLFFSRDFEVCTELAVMLAP